MKNILRCVVVFLGMTLMAVEKQPYVVGKLKGQFGNQLFQIAATVSLALDHDAAACFPDFLQVGERSISINHEHLFLPWGLQASPPDGRRIRYGYYYKESGFEYAPIPYYPNVVLDGYFQSEKYFEHHKQEILDLFAPPQAVMQYISLKYQDVLDHPNTVGVHLRNYQRPVQEHPMHITYGRDYFERAILQFPEDALFVVCSNQIDWAKEVLAGIPRNFYFVEGNPHYIDFYLMSFCKHNIISNSSFSWWAAYLNANSEKVVITPPYWFDPKLCDLNTQDLIPARWIILH